MTTRKNYNSIVFLTTLSVYLGLVLVGAPAPVLAQAALTSRFEVKEKIEKKDDLDKKPDDEKDLAAYASTFERLFVLADDYLTKKHSELRGGRYEFDCFINVGINNGIGHNVTCSGGSNMFWGGFIAPLVIINQTFPHTNTKESKQVKVNLVLSDEEFSLKTIFNQDLPEQAEQFYNFYDAGLSRIKLQQTDSSKTSLYENTKISAENNQVIVVTRLPRGSLDALLVKDSAK